MGRPLKLALCRNSDNCPHAKANMPLCGPHRVAMLRRANKALEMTVDEPEGAKGKQGSLKWLYTIIEALQHAKYQ